MIWEHIIFKISVILFISTNMAAYLFLGIEFCWSSYVLDLCVVIASGNYRYDDTNTRRSWMLQNHSPTLFDSFFSCLIQPIRSLISLTWKIGARELVPGPGGTSYSISPLLENKTKNALQLRVLQVFLHKDIIIIITSKKNLWYNPSISLRGYLWIDDFCTDTSVFCKFHTSMAVQLLTVTAPLLLQVLCYSSLIWVHALCYPADSIW